MTNAMTPSEIADWVERFGCNGRSAEVVATIRAQAEALKIATEALEVFKDEADAWELMGCSDREPIVEAFNGYEGRLTVGDLRRASEALARIKEQS